MEAFASGSKRTDQKPFAKIKELRLLGLLMLGLGAGQFQAGAAQNIALAWDQSFAADVAGYRLRYGTQSGRYTSTVQAGVQTRATVSGLLEGITYFFTVVAYDSKGVESDPSIELSYTVPDGNRPRLTISPVSYPTRGMRVAFESAVGLQYDLQVSSDLRTWTNLWRSQVATTVGWLSYVDSVWSGPGKRFYRVQIH